MSKGGPVYDSASAMMMPIALAVGGAIIACFVAGVAGLVVLAASLARAAWGFLYPRADALLDRAGFHADPARLLVRLSPLASAGVLIARAALVVVPPVAAAFVFDSDVLGIVSRLAAELGPEVMATGMGPGVVEPYVAFVILCSLATLALPYPVSGMGGTCRRNVLRLASALVLAIGAYAFFRVYIGIGDAADPVQVEAAVLCVGYLFRIMVATAFSLWVVLAAASVLLWRRLPATV